jgi:integrase/recombinase XerD
MPALTIELLTEQEIQRVLASINTRTAYGARNYAIIVVLLDTGLRCGELCGLTLEDVHLDGKHCHVKVLGKGQKELTNCYVHLAPDQLAAFQKRLSTGSD